MAKLVTKCKFLNAQTAKRIDGYAEYIATRERVEKLDDSILYAPATSKQKQFIKKLLKDFPDCKEMLEYEDYKNEATIGNASEFISRAVEENLHGEMDAKTYADYIATRPRAERFGSHGLFTGEGVQVQLKNVSRELNQHKGNVWTFITTLRRLIIKTVGETTAVDSFVGYAETAAIMNNCAVVNSYVNGTFVNYSVLNK